MSVRIHYPEVFDGSSVIDKRILMIRHRTSLILRKDLIGLSGWSGMRTRDKLQKGQLKFSKTSLGQTEGCALSKGDSLCYQQKENTFPFLFLGYI
jgi:hypothetical protein